LFNPQTTADMDNTANLEKSVYETKVDSSTSRENSDPEAGSMQDGAFSAHELHRKLNSKQVQLFAIGGAIGTSLYVQMGSVLPKGGPAGLFIGFLIWGGVMLCVNECFGMCCV
jgi:yeast amino acid transporter